MALRYGTTGARVGSHLANLFLFVYIHSSIQNVQKRYQIKNKLNN